MFVRNILLLISIVGSLYAENLVLNIRDNGKICTSWMAPFTGSVSYDLNRECISGISAEYTPGYTQVRLCCQGVALTTIAPNFPKQCGKQLYTPLGQRIIGGSVATAHSWPWQALVYGPNNMCGGSLIDERHVITAAHCITSTQDPYTVIIGLHDREGVMYMEQIVKVEKIYVHEQYDSVAIRNDVALLYLSKPVQVTDKVNFICLPGPEATIGDKVVVSGWGKTAGNGDSSNVLKQTDLTVSNCGQFWAPSQYDANQQICAVKSGSGSCQGDSGGPLMYQSNGQWYLNGIVSFGESVCNTNSGSVYARVSYFLPWFKAKMALAGKN